MVRETGTDLNLFKIQRRPVAGGAAGSGAAALSENRKLGSSFLSLPFQAIQLNVKPKK